MPGQDCEEAMIETRPGLLSAPAAPRQPQPFTRQDRSWRDRLGSRALQTRFDGASHFMGGDLKLGDGLAQIAKTSCGLLQLFGCLGYTPGAQPSRGAFERVRRRSRVGGLGARDSL